MERTDGEYLVSEAWRADARCLGLDPNAFFPSDVAGVDAACEVCAKCAVRQVCLEYALTNNIQHGVWGGASERERRRILKKRRESQV